jgi:hypothetical protein
MSIPRMRFQGVCDCLRLLESDRPERYFRIAPNNLPVRVLLSVATAGVTFRVTAIFELALILLK